MNKHTRPFSAPAATGIAMLLMVLGFALQVHAATTTSDCVGKPYGYPGCPTRPSPTSLSTSSAGSGICGNAIVEPGEECDKGRFNGKSDCSLTCRHLYCGDGIVTKSINEECEPETQEVYVQDDQGNLTTEMHFVGNAQCGWYCQPPSSNDSGTCTGGCKLKYIGDCAASGSVLSSSAASGSGAAMSTKATSSTPPLPATCGNDVVDPGEECDDGNKVNNDECTNNCTLPKCGDGIVQKGEECDDDNHENADNCTNDCKLPRCGDGILQSWEACDNGPRNSDVQPNACRTNCSLPVCGDGVTDKGEQCDAGVQASDTKPDSCRTNCHFASCGDGVVDANEECDDGNRIDTDDCSNACKHPFCGDGILQVSEQCDWGNRNSDTEPNACRTSCRIPRCGDHVVDTGEQCDGGRNCTKDCKLAPQTDTVASSAPTSSSAASVAPRIPAVHVSTPTSSGDSSGGGSALPVALGVTGIVAVLAATVFRKKLLALVTSKSAKSIDDIPLDKIEMPWHKW